jgi:hypothetical protein
MKKNERGLLPFVVACVILFLVNAAKAQIYLPKAPPEPSEYGNVVLDPVLDPYAAAAPGG